MSSRGVGSQKARDLSVKLVTKENEARVAVLCFDIRNSTRLMLNSEDLNGYATELAKFVADVKTIVNQHGGWFDKFTGDGAIAFWVLDELTQEDFASILTGCVWSMENIWIHYIMPMISHTAGSLPAGFGLGTGIDYGRCLLSDLQPPANFGVNRVDSQTHKTTRFPVGGHPPTLSVTVLGRPVVGAVRLAEAADPFEILANPPFAVPLVHNHRLLPHGCRVSQRKVSLKEPIGDQIAYQIHMRNLDDELASHYPHLSAAYTAK